MAEGSSTPARSMARRHSGPPASAFASVWGCTCIEWVGTVWRRTRRQAREMGIMDTMSIKRALCSLLLLAAAACGDEKDPVQPAVPTSIESLEGDEQIGLVGSTLPNPLGVK